MPFPPRRSRSEPTYKIDELEVNARLVDQVAEVQVSQTFVNTGSMPLEVSFVFPLPYEGAIHQMTLLVDGKEFPARLLDAKEARRTLRGDRAEEPRPGAAGMDGHGHVPDERLSGSARRQADGDAALLAALPASRKG